MVVDPSLKTGLTVILSRADDRALLTYLRLDRGDTREEVDRELLARGRHVHLGVPFCLDAGPVA